MFTDASGVGVIREGKAGGVSGACPVGGKNIILRVEERERGGYSRQLLCNEELFWLRPVDQRCGVQGAKACASLSFRGRRVKS
eukprot:scaffold9972_cov118-Isochrysis_galbana.AAC.8